MQGSQAWAFPEPQERPWPNVPSNFMFFSLQRASKLYHVGPHKTDCMPAFTHVCLPLDCELLQNRQRVSFPAVHLGCSKHVRWIEFKEIGYRSTRNLGRGEEIKGQMKELGKRQRKCVTGRLRFLNVLRVNSITIS